jgi:hypothetical protein
MPAMMTNPLPSPTSRLGSTLEGMRAAIAAEGPRKGLAGKLQDAILMLLKALVTLLAEFRAGTLAPHGAVAPHGAATARGAVAAGAPGAIGTCPAARPPAARSRARRSGKARAGNRGTAGEAPVVRLPAAVMDGVRSHGRGSARRPSPACRLGFGRSLRFQAAILFRYGNENPRFGAEPCCVHNVTIS